MEDSVVARGGAKDMEGSFARMEIGRYGKDLSHGYTTQNSARRAKASGKWSSGKWMDGVLKGLSPEFRIPGS